MSMKKAPYFVRELLALIGRFVIVNGSNNVFGVCVSIPYRKVRNYQPTHSMMEY